MADGAPVVIVAGVLLGRGEMEPCVVVGTLAAVVTLPELADVTTDDVLVLLLVVIGAVEASVVGTPVLVVWAEVPDVAVGTPAVGKV